MHNFVVQEIPLTEIVTGKSNVRVHNIDKDIEELAEHIKVNGLLEPIVVFKNPSGKYEILAGQRRFTAIQSLGWDKIWCNVRDPPKDEADAKAISIGENLTQLPMTLEDSIEACTFLFERYGDEGIVAKKHGISKSLVKKYVRFARLPDFLKESCRNGELGNDPKKAMTIALKAVDSLNWEKGGDVEDQKVKRFAKLLSEKSKDSASEANDIADEARQDSSRSVEEIAEAATKQKKKKVYKIILNSDYDEKLNKYADTEGLEPGEAASNLIVQSLDEKISSE